MSNYINNLIAKNQPAAEVVRPRLPSIFEPSPVEARIAYPALNLVGPLARQEAADEEINPRPPQARQAESNAVMTTQPPPAGEAFHVNQVTDVPSPGTGIPAWRGLQRLPMIDERTDEVTIAPPATAPPGEPSFTPRLPDVRDNTNRFATAIHSNLTEPPDESPQYDRETGREIRLSPRPVDPPYDETLFAESSNPPGVQADAEQPAPPKPPGLRPAHERIAQPIIEEAKPPDWPIASSARRIESSSQSGVRANVDQAPPKPPGRWLAHERIAQQVIEEAKPPASPVAASPRRIVVQPHVAQRDEHDITPEGHRSAEQRLAFQSHEPSMPTINVTIGRIEVRALPPAAAPPRAQKTAAPLMSLEEYMRRRNAGGDSV
jgi:hypothetical protein